MNLVTRGVTPDPATAALAAVAALRSLEASNVEAPAVWVARGVRFDATAAWDHGIALVRVANAEAESAAHGVVRAVGARIVLSANDLRHIGGPRGDGARLAARHELCLWPDEHVEVAIGADRDPTALTSRLDAFDELVTADPDMPRRLVLAGLTRRGAKLSEPMLRAILHPLILVEIDRSDEATMALLRQAADVVTPAA